MLKAGALILFAALAATPSIPPSQPHQQAVGVQPNQQTNAARSTNGGADKRGTRGLPAVPIKPLTRGPEHPDKCGYECQRRAEERSEYWIILGHLTKITDFFLALFTMLLV